MFLNEPKMTDYDKYEEWAEAIALFDDDGGLTAEAQADLAAQDAEGEFV